MSKRNTPEIKNVVLDVSSKVRKTQSVSCVGKESEFRCKSLQDRPPCKVLVAGQGDLGQLGLGPNDGLPVKSPLRSFNKCEFTVVPGLTDIVEACAGGLHTVCLTRRGEVLTFGCNDEGALGRRLAELDDDPGATPGKVELEGEAVQISAGYSHSAALLEDGRAFAWGSFKDSHGTIWKKIKLPILLDVVGTKKIASGWNHMMLLTRIGEVFSCGCPEQGQLGRVIGTRAHRKFNRTSESYEYADGVKDLLTPLKMCTLSHQDEFNSNQTTLQQSSLEPVSSSESNPSYHPLPTSSNHLVVNIWAGACSSFLEFDDKNVHISGLNTNKQLGHEDPTCHYSLTKSTKLSTRDWVKICGDLHHTLGLDSDGLVYALGSKDFGRLGLGKYVFDDNVPEPELGEPTVVSGLKDKNCVDVSCGNSCSFAVTEDGTLFAWGMGCSGQLGLDVGAEDVWEPARVNGQELERFFVRTVSAGGQHTVLLAQDRDDVYAIDKTTIQ